MHLDNKLSVNCEKEMFTFEIYLFHCVHWFSELCKFRTFQKKIPIFLFNYAVNSEILHFFRENQKDLCIII